MASVIIPNEKFIDLLIDNEQTIMIDANLIIPPDRSELSRSSGRKLKVEFTKYKEDFLELVIECFPNLAIHESVYAEIELIESIREYVDEKIRIGDIRLLKDSDLVEKEKIIRDTIEYEISQFTNYNPSLDNAKDRGEVKSLAYAATKNIYYFSTNDSNAISLLDRNELQTYLYSVGAIKVYELIYLLKVSNRSSKTLKGLYKLLYYLTPQEKRENFDWASFISEANKHYAEFIETFDSVKP